MRHTLAEVEFIETIAKEQLKYETIFSAEAELLRTDPLNFEAAMAQIQQSQLIAKRGQRWEPTQDNVDWYLAQCNDICQLVPQNFDDRVKILHAAHGALMCLITCKIAKQPERVQLAILKRHHELTHPASPVAIDRPSTLSKPAVEPRRITTEDLQLFQIPDNLHRKHFILSPDTEASGMYEVIGYYRERDKSVQYDVLFEDCDNYIRVDAKEMMGMLENSLYLPI